MPNFSVEPGKKIPFSVKKLIKPKVLSYVSQHLKNEGVLKARDEFYAYLKVDDNFIYKLFPLLEENDFSMPAYFTPPEDIGAHISLFYENEITQPFKLLEVNTHHTFLAGELYLMQAFQKKYIVLSVISKSLADLRRKYELPEKISYRGLLIPFHITIAVAPLEG